MSVRFTIVCDHDEPGTPPCLAESFRATSMAGYRRALAKIGWRHDAATGTDYCPRHARGQR